MDVLGAVVMSGLRRSEASGVVWKFTLLPFVAGVAEMPRGAQLLHVAAQGDDVCVWVLCDMGAKKVYRKVQAVPTGFGAPGTYVGTAHLDDGDGGELVFHVFDDGEIEP